MLCTIASQKNIRFAKISSYYPFNLIFIILIHTHTHRLCVPPCFSQTVNSRKNGKQEKCSLWRDNPRKLPTSAATYMRSESRSTDFTISYSIRNALGWLRLECVTIVTKCVLKVTGRHVSESNNLEELNVSNQNEKLKLLPELA
jgi:hypothetical protein